MMDNSNDKTIKELSLIAYNARVNLIEMAYLAGRNCAHCGGSLSAIEILTVLYHKVAHRLNKEIRDRIILSKAHASLGHYCILESMGFLTKDDLMSFEQNGSHFTAHAKKDLDKGLEFTGGSLGLGMSYAVGVAYALKEKGSNEHVYVLLGDGECNEGIVWESLMFASHYNLNNLTIIVDHNHLQADGFTEDVMNMGDLTQKITSFGFYAQQVNGHSLTELISAFGNRNNEKPNAIIAETVKGKGISFMENNYSWHFFVLTKGKYKKAMEELIAKKEEYVHE